MAERTGSLPPPLFDGFVIHRQPKTLSEVYQDGDNPIGLIFPQVTNHEYWQQRKSGKAVLVDLSQRLSYEFSGSSPKWEIKQTFTEILPAKGTYSAIIILAPHAGQEFASSMDQIFQQYLPHLSEHDAPIFILERLPEAERTGTNNIKLLYKQRRNYFNSAEVSKLTKASRKVNLTDGGFFWVARSPKEREPIDLIARLAVSSDPWKRALIDDIKRRVRLIFETQGFSVISFAEIDKVLHRCNNPPQAFRDLRQGFGIELHGQGCGCEWKCDLKGNFENRVPCSARIHNFESRRSISPETESSDLNNFSVTDNGKRQIIRNQARQKYHAGEIIHVGQTCRDCFTHNAMVRVCIDQGEVKPGIFQFQVDEYCEHCGSPASRYVTIDTNKL